MSKGGILAVASVFSAMQEVRHNLIKLAVEKDKADLQDLMLAQLLQTGKDAMKERFAEITLMKKEG